MQHKLCNSVWGTALATLCLMLMSIAATSCDDDKEIVNDEKNPAKYIADESKLKMLYSLTDLEQKRGGAKGRIYEMNYTADYDLDAALKAEITGLDGLTKFMATTLFDIASPDVAHLQYGAGCSAYAATEATSGDFLMGRNYDFCHQENGKEVDIAAIVVHTHPKDGKRSISIVDGYWLGYTKGFFNDGKTDLSMLMAVPFAPMDGMNEDGFAIGVLHLDGLAAVQKEAGKPNIYLSVAMRMLLDKASTVKEAIALLQQYNMTMDSPAGGSFHFFMADATGEYAIVEYVDPNGDSSVNPWKMHVMGLDEVNKNDYRYVTNFYVSPYMENSPYGIDSGHGTERYNKLKNTLTANNYILNMTKALGLLVDVSQEAKDGDLTSHTQWSSLYNLKQRTLNLSILREYGQDKMWEFNINK